MSGATVAVTGLAVAARRATAVQALRRLLVVTAAVALLGHGGVQLTPRLMAAGAGSGAAVGGTTTHAPAPARSVAERPALAGSRPGERAVALRLSRVLAVPAGSTQSVAGPGSSPLVAPLLPAGPGARPPTSPAVRSVLRGASGRAPPVAAGT
ncbi:MAG: hypothetical protein WD794_15135 [Mycobacteriales bacterium]